MIIWTTFQIFCMVFLESIPELHIKNFTLKIKHNMFKLAFEILEKKIVASYLKFKFKK